MGGGRQKFEFTKSTLREQLNWVVFFSFSYSCIGVQLNFLPSLFFTSPRALSGEVGDKGWGWGSELKAGSCLIVLLLPFWFVCDAGSCAGGSSYRRCAVLHLVRAAGAKLVDPVGVDPVDPALVKVDEEHHIWSAEGGGEKKKKFQMVIGSRDALVAQGDAPSLRQPILYIMGILMTKANRSSINVLSAL